MDERLSKALEFGNYMLTLNNQKRLLKEKFLDQSVYYVDGHKFSINRELISYVKTLIDLHNDKNIVLIDDHNQPYRCQDLNQFLLTILDIYQTNLNSYHTEFQKIKNKRSVEDLIK